MSGSTPRRTAVYVGLFVTGAIAILGGGILAVGNVRETFSRKIAVSTVFDEVTLTAA